MKRILLILLALLLIVSASAESLGTTGYALNVPEGYTLTNDATDDDPMFYCYPENADTPVRFMFFTTGSGECRSMAATARLGYQAFYDSYEATEVHDAVMNGYDVVTFSYICSYLDEAEKNTVYEQTAICYLPMEDGRFVAWIVSLSFDSETECLSEEEMDAFLETAAACVVAA